MELRSRYLRASVITPTTILLVAAGYLIQALLIAPPIEDGVLTPSFYPVLIALLAFPLCAKLLIDGIRESKAAESRRKLDISAKPLILAAVTGLFILAFAYLGFLLSAPLYVFFFMLFFDDRPQQIGKKVLMSLLIVAGVYVLYELIFGIHFPELWRG